MRAVVRKLAGDSVLAGAAPGEATMLAIAATIPSGADEVLFLDFDKVDVATASFLRSLIFGLRDFCRGSRPNVSVVVANMNERLQEELLDRLSVMREAIATCRLDSRMIVSDARVLGVLEEKQAETLAAVIAESETDAPTLARNDIDSDTTVNKWNNRLSALAAKGLIKERRIGRTKRYSPILKGLDHGT